MIEAQGSGPEPAHPSETNQRAKFRISPHEIANLLDLPGDLRVVRVHALFDPAAIEVVVEGRTLEPQPFNCELPLLAGASVGESIVGPDGRRYVRFGWMRR